MPSALPTVNAIRPVLRFIAGTTATVPWLFMLAAPAADPPVASTAQAVARDLPERAAAAQVKLRDRLVGYLYGEDEKARESQTASLVLFALTYDLEEGFPSPLRPGRIVRTDACLRGADEPDKSLFAYTGSLRVMTLCRLLPHLKRLATDSEAGRDAGGVAYAEYLKQWEQLEAKLVSDLTGTTESPGVWGSSPATPAGPAADAVWDAPLGAKPAPMLVRYKLSDALSRPDHSAMQFVAMAYHLHQGLGAPDEGTATEARIQEFWRHSRTYLGSGFPYDPARPPGENRLPEIGLKTLVDEYGERDAQGYFNRTLGIASTYFLACLHTGGPDQPPEARCVVPCGVGVGPSPSGAAAPSMSHRLWQAVDWLGREPRGGLAVPATTMGDLYGYYGYERFATYAGITSVPAAAAEPASRGYARWYDRLATAICDRVTPLAAAPASDGEARVDAFSFLVLAKSVPGRVPWVQLSARPDGSHFHLTALGSAADRLRARGLDFSAWRNISLRSARLSNDLGNAPLAFVTETEFPELLRHPRVVPAVRDYIGRGGCLVFENAGRTSDEARAFRRATAEWVRDTLGVELATSARHPDVAAFSLDPWSTVATGATTETFMAAATHGPRWNVIYFEMPLSCSVDTFCDAGWRSMRDPPPPPLSPEAAAAALEGLLRYRTAGYAMPWRSWAAPPAPPSASEPPGVDRLEIGWLAGRVASPAGRLLEALRLEPTPAFVTGAALPLTTETLEAAFTKAAGRLVPAEARLTPLAAFRGDEAPYDVVITSFGPAAGSDQGRSEEATAFHGHLAAFVARGGAAYLELPGAIPEETTSWREGLVAALEAIDVRTASTALEDGAWRIDVVRDPSAGSQPGIILGPWNRLAVLARIPDPAAWPPVPSSQAEPTRKQHRDFVDAAERDFAASLRDLWAAPPGGAAP